MVPKCGQSFGVGADPDRAGSILVDGAGGYGSAVFVLHLCKPGRASAAVALDRPCRPEQVLVRSDPQVAGPILGERQDQVGRKTVSGGEGHEPAIHQRTEPLAGANPHGPVPSFEHRGDVVVDQAIRRGVSGEVSPPHLEETEIPGTQPERSLAIPAERQQFGGRTAIADVVRRECFVLVLDEAPGGANPHNAACILVDEANLARRQTLRGRVPRGLSVLHTVQSIKRTNP